MQIYLLLLVLAFPFVHSIDVIPNPSHSYGGWNGWGTSLCWFAAAFGDRQDVVEVLYTRQNVAFQGNTVPGLGFNIARYNAGAESSDKVNGSSMVLSPNMIVGREIEGYWVTPDRWDWSRDALQTSFIKTIVKLSEIPSQLDFELFSNSPMWWQLYNLNPSGAKNGKDDNLNIKYYQQHAEYLTTIAKYFHDTHNITFKTIEAFNEPIATWWHATNNQEGCHFSVSSQSTLLPILQSSLQNAGLNDVKIVASDESYFSQAISTFKSMSSDIQNMFTRVNVHGYQTSGNPDHDRDTLYQLTSNTHRIRMNEHGDGDDSGATLAQAIIDDINILHAEAWVYWQALDGGGWGLISADINAKSISNVNTKYYILAQFSRHLRVNDIIVENNDMKHTVTAYRTNSQNIPTFVIFITYNPSSSSFNYTYSIQPFISSTIPSLTITSWFTTTTGTSHYVPLGTSYVNGTSYSMEIPAYSVMTTEIEMTSNIIMHDDIAME